jgi:LPS sulfotransferase NodH
MDEGLSRVETGYEAKFDFPARARAPERPYLLATVPRSGSTDFSHLLWRTGCLGAPLEYLNFDPDGPYGHANASPAEQTRLWQSALRHRTSPNGVFGLKGFPLQFEALQQDNPALLGAVMREVFPSRAASRIVHLRRRDRTAHAISYARAILSGIWRREQEQAGADEPDYSPIAVERAARMIESQEESWDAMCADLGITPLALWYEDVVAEPDRAVAAVAEYLGVPLDPGAVVEIPSIVRQSQEGASLWAAKHEGR